MKTLIPSLIIPAFLLLISCGGESTELSTEDSKLQKENHRYDLSLADKLEIFGSLPTVATNPSNASTTEKIKLGQQLYFDKRLSMDGNISCNSCHNLSTAGVDNLPTSPGDKGENGDRNSPTVFNAALHSSQFWDGRAKDVEEQAGMPILNPVEMAMPSEAFVVKRLKEIPEYQGMFSEAFPNESDPITYENLKSAIGVFERELITPSRFDRYLSGDKSALNLNEKKGLAAFISVGCTSCHAGNVLGGNQIQKLGVHHDYWNYIDDSNKDEGRFAVTGKEYDKYFFKVPSLRNITLTAPYYHNGSEKDLKKVIKTMAKIQLDIDLTDTEVSNIEAFLHSLEGDIPEKYKQDPFQSNPS